MGSENFWRDFLLAYLFTISIETPILLIGLSRKRTWQQRLFLGVWLTACTYPIVWIVLPKLLNYQENYYLYLAVAETFAPVAECLLFSLMWGWKEARWQDWLTIVIANLASFLLGTLIEPV